MFWLSCYLFIFVLYFIKIINCKVGYILPLHLSTLSHFWLISVQLIDIKLMSNITHVSIKGYFLHLKLTRQIASASRPLHMILWMQEHFYSLAPPIVALKLNWFTHLLKLCLSSDVFYTHCKHILKRQWTLADFVVTSKTLVITEQFSPLGKDSYRLGYFYSLICHARL